MPETVPISVGHGLRVAHSCGSYGSSGPRSARANHLVMQNSHMAKAAKRGQWQAAARILEAAPETREDWGKKVGAGGANITINFRFTRDPEPPMVDVTPAMREK